MKKAVLREYLKNRKKDVVTINQDSFFTIEVEEPTNDMPDVAMELVKKAVKRTRKPKGEK